jgi:DNA-binding GntR family transcriptional regulator
MELPKLQRTRATDDAYRALREAILTRVFKPGERLQVDEISAKLGVSLTPVRHAIQHLATEGLIEIHPRSGTYVANVTPEETEETFDIRCALECLAGELAVGRVTEGELQAMRRELQELAKPVTDDAQLRRHEKANSELHQLLIQAAGNRRLAEMYESLNAHIKIARIHLTEGSTGERRDWSARLDEEQAEHEAIVQALEARDVAALTAAIRKHIYRAKASLVGSLKQLALPKPPSL